MLRLPVEKKNVSCISDPDHLQLVYSKKFLKNQQKTERDNFDFCVFYLLTLRDLTSNIVEFL